MELNTYSDLGFLLNQLHVTDSAYNDNHILLLNILAFSNVQVSTRLDHF
jgi:hypothetical protein